MTDHWELRPHQYENYAKIAAVSDGRIILWSVEAHVAKQIVHDHNRAETAESEVDRLNRLVETLSRALARYQDEEDEVGGDEVADHPYQRRGSWSHDDWCAVDGCTSKVSAHP